MALRLLTILKENGIKQPSGFKIDENAGTGLKEDKGENDVFDINNISNQGSQLGDPELDEAEGGEPATGGGEVAADFRLLNKDLTD
jgi:hypothetical protein